MATAIKILFIAGFGPIVPKPADSRKLYSEVLGIRFKEESGEYLHTEALKGAKPLRCGHCLTRRSHAPIIVIPDSGPRVCRIFNPGQWTYSLRYADSRIP